MPAVDFIDTNVVIYTLDDTAPAKQSIARDLLCDAATLGTAIISYQVVQESLNTLVKKFSGRLSGAQADIFLEHTLLPLLKVMPSASLWRHAVQLQRETAYSFYDSLIVAAALSAGCKRLLSEDLQHGQVIEGLKIVNPFA